MREFAIAIFEGTDYRLLKWDGAVEQEICTWDDLE